MRYCLFHVEIKHTNYILLFVPGYALVHVVLFINVQHTTYILYVFFPQNHFFMCYINYKCCRFLKFATVVRSIPFILLFRSRPLSSSKYR